ncbi:hypothetical protein TanjilG_09540 [Lupinus angustifolius]|uniref:Transmembrane protein n=1 Tax=Lupinus angustifolius TaxID=3871 RepID=A0A1J7GCC7_LUPAN|nr:PREDICTED: uncharacterized protein LOC109326174 isoform X2 [Lupinus angustifolius]OIV98047.1 hypothetical protein TanjilG_09540 [Lupinus angustifolius]
MFNFADENYRIPWLIWIQLIVFILLLLLLFSFILLPLDPDHDAAAVTAAAATTVLATASTSNNDIIQLVDKQSLSKQDSTVTVVTNHRHHSQSLRVKGEIEASSSMRREEITEEEEEASLSFHPCHYFQLATVAFLKCFGLDSTCDTPPTQKHMKRKES